MNETDYNFYPSSSSYAPCKKHPSSSPVGICAYCLKDRLMKLVCSDCGEQRLSSCSCSDVSSYRNSSCTVDVGSVGRISFLIENDEQRSLFDIKKHNKKQETEDVVLLKRSNSCVVEVKKSNGFWRIGKLFKKRREKEECCRESVLMDVSRSRSLCSYRGGVGFGGGGFDHEVGSVVSDMAYSSAKISDFNESEPRKSGFRGGLMDFEHGFSAKESEFSRIHDDSSFIDLKLDLSDRSKTEYPVFSKNEKTECSVFKSPLVGGGGGTGIGIGVGGGGLSSSSCRITVNERGIKKGSKGHSKVWKWIFKQHSGKKDLNHILES